MKFLNCLDSKGFYAELCDSILKSRIKTSRETSSKTEFNLWYLLDEIRTFLMKIQTAKFERFAPPPAKNFLRILYFARARVFLLSGFELLTQRVC